MNVPFTEKHGPNGDYYELALKFIILFGLTEMKAQLSWDNKVCHILPTS
jgi:hypothetical protein